MKTSDIFSDYQIKIINLIQQIDKAALTRAADLLLAAYKRKKTIFIVGNGGSSATAMHMACDFAKTIRGREGNSSPLGFRAINLSDNNSLMSAWANDVGYEKVYSGQLESWGQEGDVLIAISSSGNSKNILNAVEKAHELKMKVIGITGFGGGELSKISDISLVSNLKEYGPVEDIQLIIGHMLTDNFIRSLSHL